MPVQRGEIHFVNLNPVQGRERASRRSASFTRTTIDLSSH